MTMRPWQANIIGVGVAGLVIGGGLILGAPEAAADGPSRPQTLGAPPQAGNGNGEIPLGDSIQMWGRPSRLGIFWTSDTTDQIAKTYWDAWVAAGLPPHMDRVDKVTSVSAIDTSLGPASGLMRSVTIIDEGDDRLVMPGISDIRVLPDLTARHAPVPVPENAFAYMGQTADDSGSVSYNGSYQVPLASSRVIDFYEKELGKDGYKVREARKKLEGGAQIEFERGAEWISIVAKDELAPSDKDAAKKAGLDDGPMSQVMVTHVRTISAKPEWKP